MRTIRLTESDLTRIVKQVIKETTGNYEKKFGGTGEIQGRSITNMGDAIKYTKGTRIDPKYIMRLVDMGHDISVFTNKSNVTGINGRHKKVFVDYTAGNIYNEKDVHMGNFKNNEFGWRESFGIAEKYLES